MSAASTQPRQTEMPGVAAAPRQVICDDLDALRRAEPWCPPDALDVLSFSPAVVLGDYASCRAIDADITTADISALFDWTIDIAAACAAMMSETGSDGHGDAAYVAARTVLQLQPALYCAMCLSRLPPGPRDFITVDYAAAEFDKRFNGAAALAATLPAITICRVGKPVARIIEPPAPPGATVGERLRFNPVTSHVYRIGRALWDRLAATPARGTVLVHRENELVKESAYYLMCRGYAVRSVPALGLASNPARADPDFADGVAAIVRAAAGPIYPPDYAAPIARFVADRVAAAVAELADRMEAYDAMLRGLEKHRPRCLLTNYVGAVDMAALHAASRRHGLPLITFQHGITAEICRPMARAWPVFEAAAGDLVCPFDQALVDLGDGALFHRARSVAVGMPSELRHSVARAAGPPGQDIWYVSTGLCRGRTAMLHIAEPDHRIARFELDNIDRVLSSLPHPVIYKPYPAIRYADGDPVVARAARAPGIRVHDGRGDFRFVAARCGVIVTARATSTLSWCLMSSRPVVFIDIPSQMPLRPEVRRLAEPGLFLFDAGDPAMADDLRAFLSRPIGEIEAEWQDRAAARATLIDAYFDTDRGPAGRRAADAIEACIKDTTR